MKKLALTGAVLSMLVLAGIAVAHGNDSQTVTKVAASFDAATVSGKIDTHTCTTTDAKSLATAHATYTGNASGAGDLTGAVKIDATSVINTTDNIGKVDGHLTITPGSGAKTDLHFTGVYDGGVITGLATGHTSTHGVQLYANLSSGFTTLAGFTGGKIGGTSGGSAVEVATAHCSSTKPEKESSSADGTITALSATSITVAGVTCSVPASLAAKVATFKVTGRAHIECSLASGTSTLTKIEARES
jgi:hypothetical protein